MFQFLTNRKTVRFAGPFSELTVGVVVRFDVPVPVLEDVQGTMGGCGTKPATAQDDARGAKTVACFPSVLFPLCASLLVRASDWQLWNWFDKLEHVPHLSLSRDRLCALSHRHPVTGLPVGHRERRANGPAHDASIH